MLTLQIHIMKLNLNPFKPTLLQVSFIDSKQRGFVTLAASRVMIWFESPLSKLLSSYEIVASWQVANLRQPVSLSLENRPRNEHARNAAGQPECGKNRAKDERRRYRESERQEARQAY